MEQPAAPELATAPRLSPGDPDAPGPHRQVTVVCPNCKGETKLPLDALGSRVGCPDCNQVFDSNDERLLLRLEIPPRTLTFPLVIISCTILEAGKNSLCGIYTVGSDGLPDALVFSSGNMSLAAVAEVTESGLAQALSANVYYIAFLADSTTAVLLAASAQVNKLLGAASPGVTPANAVYKDAQAFGSGLPNPFPGTPTYSTGTVMPYITMRS